MALVPLQAVAKPSDCDWSESPCTEEWSHNFGYVLVQVNATPPCSVLLHYSYQYRCLGEMEVPDINVQLNPATFVPPYCTTPGDVMAWFYTNGGSYASIFVNPVVDVEMQRIYDYVVANPAQYNSQNWQCPSRQKLIQAKLARCYKIHLSFNTFMGPREEIVYDFSKTWEDHVIIMNLAWGPLSPGPSLPQLDPMVHFRNCDDVGCCYRERTYCFNTTTNQFEYTDGNWQSQGPPCNPANGCTYVICTD